MAAGTRPGAQRERCRYRLGCAPRRLVPPRLPAPYGTAQAVMCKFIERDAGV